MICLFLMSASLKISELSSLMLSVTSFYESQQIFYAKKKTKKKTMAHHQTEMSPKVYVMKYHGLLVFNLFIFYLLHVKPCHVVLVPSIAWHIGATREQ